MAEAPDPALIDVDPAKVDLPVLHRAPGQDAFAPVTFTHKGTLGLVEFDRPPDAQPQTERSVTFTLSQIGEAKVVRYIADLSQVCNGEPAPVDSAVQALIVEAAARYARRLERGLDSDDPDDEDDTLTFCGYDDTRSAEERASAQTMDGLITFATTVRRIIGGIDKGELRQDHAAHVIAVRALSLLRRYR